MKTALGTTCLAVLLVLASVVALPAQERPAGQRSRVPAVLPRPAIEPVVRQPVTAAPSRAQPATPLQVTVSAPKPGQTIPLDGKVLQIPFTVQNLDPNKTYAFMPELVRNGTVFGPIFGMGFVVNPNQNPIVVGVKAGHYLANYADQLASPGPGYQYQITVYEGTWGKGHTVSATGLSGTFSFGPPPLPAGPVQVTVAAPEAGQTIPLDGKVLQIPFTVQNLDPNKTYAFMPELVRNGTVLGPIFGMGFVVNPNQNPIVVGVKAGHYLANYADQLASPGPGYQYRITVYEGSWGKGHKISATGLSGTFSFNPAP